MSLIERWYYCPGCERIGPMSDFQDECRPGWTHGALCCVDRESPALAAAQGAVNLDDAALARASAALEAVAKKEGYYGLDNLPFDEVAEIAFAAARGQ